mmetsp:Transcript_61406/g.171680  ORF Transcript_61406/g.171680 Transcript_61406/m.171680 type:complete len:537 (-) Transcript_61406:104-1714(-)
MVCKCASLGPRADRLASLLTKQGTDLLKMKEEQDRLRDELHALREKHERLHFEAEDLRAVVAGVHAALGDSGVEQDPDGDSGHPGEALEMPAAPTASESGAVQLCPPSFDRKMSGDTPLDADGIDRRLATLAESRSSSLYNLCLPLIRGTSSSKAKSAALAKVAAALDMGESPHEWLGQSTPLNVAVRARNLELVRVLLRAQGDPNERDEQDVSLLHKATFDGQVEICRLLLEAQADPNVLDRYDQSPICFAPTKVVCDLLCRRYADINGINHKGQSALHLAALGGLSDVMLWLASRVTHAVLSLRDAHGNAAINYARQNGVRPDAILKVEQIMNGGARVSLKTPRPWTAQSTPLPPEQPPGSPEQEHDCAPEHLVNSATAELTSEARQKFRAYCSRFPTPVHAGTPLRASLQARQLDAPQMSQMSLATSAASVDIGLHGSPPRASMENFTVAILEAGDRLIHEGKIDVSELGAELMNDQRYKAFADWLPKHQPHPDGFLSLKDLHAMALRFFDERFGLEAGDSTSTRASFSGPPL